MEVAAALVDRDGRIKGVAQVGLSQDLRLRAVADDATSTAVVLTYTLQSKTGSTILI